ncbi:HAD-IIB family hydrolase [Thiorhodococcus mannitoliphagus]|uniref:HAD-IIB family hydrolase n=1 Tax=Thiorhodococcus mannitoliphagus TaxID=329406 RepID=A0A6P1DWA2_9GAMM|nr:HAD-IIB family hydrolase [Thiorhodococcus mannitoliphagus]NEX21979.1 HAD-IIB family hydrolase [Thiorhodococcus mannitoliphagus]
MKILATDLDRTLLPNGRWEGDPEAIERFNALTREQGVTLVYVTGRNLALTERAIEDFGVRRPDYLIGDVGTSIRRLDQDQWAFDEGWVAHVKRASPRWDAAAVRAAVADIAGLREQEAEHLNPFKQSYYVDHARNEEILKLVHERVEGRFDEVIIYSFDSQNGKGLLDFLPKSATKQTALEYVAEQLGTPKDEVVFCGDSGNDIFPLTAGFSGVLVRNADDQLVEKVREAMADNPELKVYFAKGDFMGLNGYYTSGVIEGAYHYGLFS